MKNILLALLTSVALLSVGISYAERFVHTLSNVCIHPKGGLDNPGNNTVLELWNKDCNASRDALDFIYSDGYGYIKHKASGKCVHPKGGSRNPGNNTKLVLHDGCTDDVKKTKFVFTAGGQLKHLNSGKCIHPQGGDSSPKDGTDLVLHDGCTGSHLAFAIEKAEFEIENSATTRLFHTASGLCIKAHDRDGDGYNIDARFSHNCNDKKDMYFTMRNNGAIKHVKSGKCFYLLLASGTGSDDFTDAWVALKDTCSGNKTEFKQISNGALQHKHSGKCIGPIGYWADPNHYVIKDHTQLVLRDICSSKAAMEFR